MSAAFILLDIGGTDIKTAIVLKGSTKLENLKRVSFPDFLHSNFGRKEIDAFKLLNIVENEIHLARSNQEDVVGVLISGQMGCWMIASGKDEISKIVSWQDNRSLDDKTLKLSDHLLQMNGGENHPGVPALGALHFARRNTGEDKHFKFETMCSYVCQALCEAETQSLVHITDAAATGIYDIFGAGWIPEKIDSDLSIFTFPKTSANVEPVGRLNGTDIPIYTGIGDQQASLLGAGLSDSNLVINIGTGGQVAALLTENSSATFKVRPFFHGKFISTRTHLPAGRFISSLLATLRKKYLPNLEYEDLWIWKLRTGNHLPVERLQPEYCEQIIDELLRKGIEIEDAVSIILISIAMEYLNAVRAMLSDNHTKIVFAGGVGQKFSNLQDFIGNELGLNVEVSNTSETTLQGLAFLACEF
jgi:xylulokinase